MILLTLFKKRLKNSVILGNTQKFYTLKLKNTCKIRVLFVKSPDIALLTSGELNLATKLAYPRSSSRDVLQLPPRSGLCPQGFPVRVSPEAGNINYS